VMTINRHNNHVEVEFLPLFADSIVTGSTTARFATDAFYV